MSPNSIFCVTFCRCHTINCSVLYHVEYYWVFNSGSLENKVNFFKKVKEEFLNKEGSIKCMKKVTLQSKVDRGSKLINPADKVIN